MLKRIYLQLIFWAIIAGINIGFLIYFLPIKVVVMSTLFVMSFQVFVFYVNSLFIFPRYFSLSNNWRFILITAIFILSVTSCQTFADYFYFSGAIFKDYPSFHPHMMMIFMRSFFWLMFIDLISTLFMMQDRIRKQAEQTQKFKAEQLNTELKLLKAQINPHFIFNTLNNIYSLTYIKSEKAPESVLMLSQMLRYVIEECANEKVNLKSEIEYIENYIKFQKMKSPADQNIIFDYSGANQDIQTPPMLFMPFIENSFKYSEIEEATNAFIKMVLKTTTDTLEFSIQNSIPKTRNHQSGSGTGIHNVKKRLEIILPEKHELEIQIKENIFYINLILNLK